MSKSMFMNYSLLAVLLVEAVIVTSISASNQSAFMTPAALPPALHTTKNHRTWTSSSSTSTSALMSTSYSARDLLYQDQQSAMERRSQVEQKLLDASTKNKKNKYLQAPKLKSKPKSGTGFGGGASTLNPKAHLAAEQAKVVKKEGVLRIDGALTPDLADKLRAYVLEQQRIAAVRTEENVMASRAFYGVENQRECRCDLQLSLLQGGFLADGDGSPNTRDGSDVDHDHVLADALQELLGKDGSLRYLYEQLVTLKGEFYEMAAVVTDPGSKRQKVHPDLPFQDKAPLYVIFLALQDVTEDMGPTSFLLRTHTAKENAKFNDQSKKDEQLSSANCRLSTLNKGDAVLFDARILHCGNANDLEKGSTRALFNFSFRNPEVTGDLGYAGSIRPDYCGKMTLEDVANALLSYGEGDTREPFSQYGDGLN